VLYLSEEIYKLGDSLRVVIQSHLSTMSRRTICCLVLVAAVCGSRVPRDFSNYVFPDGFKLGVATASYQVEGAWNEDGKFTNSCWLSILHSESLFNRK
jgi:hypothetical protein